MKCPSIYRFQGRWWHGGFDAHGNKGGWRNLIGELAWLTRHGEVNTGWNWPELIFGIGRTWYDGPIWFVHFGIWSADLSPRSPDPKGV